MAEKGTLIIQTYTAKSSIPIADVSVTVFTETGGKKQLIAYRTTDRNGHTEPVELEAPEAELSQHPTEEKVFFSCNVQLDHPQYYSVLVEDVQVFAGTESIQPMEMIPLVEYQKDAMQQREYIITPQNL